MREQNEQEKQNELLRVIAEQNHEKLIPNCESVLLLTFKFQNRLIEVNFMDIFVKILVFNIKFFILFAEKEIAVFAQQKFN